eukprot:Partr_v1_DN28753_c0_g1_i12_m63158 putative Protein tyrosine phosphatase
MVWERNCPVIVMLANTVEAGMRKCHSYWPPIVGESVSINNLYRVTLVAEKSINSSLVERQFLLACLKSNENVRTISQLHYVSWPDHSVPKSPLPILEMAKHYHNHPLRQRNGGPTLVHCSAGVGRTGTFCAIYTLLEMMRRDNGMNEFGTSDSLLFRLVESFRRQRPHMVEAHAQYAFCYEAFRYAHARKFS